MNRTTARLSAALITVALVGIAGPAFAHVSVSSTDASPGGFGKAVFRVPTESETASTTKLVITLPQDTPFAFLNAQTKPGWKVTIKEAKLAKPTKVGDFELTKAVRTVTWTSTGAGIPPSQFDEFAISGGPFPDADTIAFTAKQTYSDGKVVVWDQIQKGDTEPEHPAPTLSLSAPVEDSAADASTPKSTSDADTTGRWLGGGALAVAAVALLVALRENRRRA
ncbi:YcnI family protein [Aeromicrobium ginsengisoli]|uniref:YcnI family protein n=1 Tax=Aeromicrobium ginsengisoli TaxID=363867 RepID=A0A5M4FGK9_9ACTN|nr:YcnI family protein [Aeromicrobium ginsengisoli]KAA1399359.1 YcnI family protein [Aeromicrobium ginsengisoli]